MEPDAEEQSGIGMIQEKDACRAFRDLLPQLHRDEPASGSRGTGQEDPASSRPLTSRV